MNAFIKWLGDNPIIVDDKEVVIANSLTCMIYTLLDGRVFVSADRALVSYDGGFYMNYEKGDETDLMILTLSANTQYLSNLDDIRYLQDSDAWNYRTSQM